MQIFQPLGELRSHAPRQVYYAASTMPLLKWIVPVLAIGVVLLAVFLPTGMEDAHLTVPYSVSAQTAQSSAYTVYLAAFRTVEKDTEVFCKQYTGDWDLSTGWDDKLGNMLTIYNFCRFEWANAKAWLQENLQEFTLGKPYDKVEPIDWNDVMAFTYVVNAGRESSWCSNSGEGFSIPASATAEEALAILEAYGTERNRAFGLWQWDGGTRLTLVEFCKANGFDPRDVSTQCYFYAYEYYTTLNYRYTYSKNQVTDPNGEYGPVMQYNQLPLTIEYVKKASEAFRRHIEVAAVEVSLGQNEAILDDWYNKWDNSWGTKPVAGGLYDFLYTYATTGIMLFGQGRG